MANWYHQRTTTLGDRKGIKPNAPRNLANTPAPKASAKSPNIDTIAQRCRGLRAVHPQAAVAAEYLKTYGADLAGDVRGCWASLDPEFQRRQGNAENWALYKVALLTNGCI